jgi:hypothetical protein
MKLFENTNYRYESTSALQESIKEIDGGGQRMTQLLVSLMTTMTMMMNIITKYIKLNIFLLLKKTLDYLIYLGPGSDLLN